ncbi:hypothetical protein MRX96_049345 [Rhipicephalus microplus]
MRTAQGRLAGTNIGGGNRMHGLFPNAESSGPTQTGRCVCADRREGEGVGPASRGKWRTSNVDIAGHGRHRSPLETPVLGRLERRPLVAATRQDAYVAQTALGGRARERKKGAALGVAAGALITVRPEERSSQPRGNKAPRLSGQAEQGSLHPCRRPTALVAPHSPPHYNCRA